MILISSKLTFLYKLTALSNALLFSIIAIVSIFYDNFLTFILITSIAISFFYFAKAIKTIYRDDNLIVCKGFFSKKKYYKDNIEKIGFIFYNIYYFKLETGKKIFFIGTSKDHRNASLDYFDLGRKEIMDKIRN